MDLTRQKPCIKDKHTKLFFIKVKNSSLHIGTCKNNEAFSMTGFHGNEMSQNISQNVRRVSFQLSDTYCFCFGI